MRVEDWEREARHLTNQVLAIENDLGEISAAGTMTLVRKKAALDHSQALFAKLAEHLRSFAKINMSKNPRGAACIHWASVLAERALAFHHKKGRFIVSYMWLNLIRARVKGGGGHPSLLVEDRDLMDLAMRLNQLHETERLLGTRLADLGQEKATLHRRYEEHLAMRTNIEASGTIQQSLGASLDEACQDPSYELLERTFRRIGALVQGPVSEHIALERLAKRVIERTDLLVSLCRDLLLSQGSLENDMEARLRRVQEVLGEIDSLEAQITSSSEALLGKVLPPPCPIFLKKKPGQDTNGVRHEQSPLGDILGDNNDRYPSDPTDRR